jgi:hypothetical protein
MNNDDILNLSKLLDVLYALANPSRSNPHDLEIIQAFNAAMTSASALIGERDASIEALKAQYPPHSGRTDWITAEHHIRRQIERGATWQQMHEGVQRYSRLVLATNRMVLNPARFFGDPDAPWSQPWPLPLPPHRMPPSLSPPWRIQLIVVLPMPKPGLAKLILCKRLELIRRYLAGGLGFLASSLHRLGKRTLRIEVMSLFHDPVLHVLTRPYSTSKP